MPGGHPYTYHTLDLNENESGQVYTSTGLLSIFFTMCQVPCMPLD
jgi:hypothetical protein